MTGSLRFADVLHDTYPPDSFAWLRSLQPVAEVGRSIRLYYIPETELCYTLAEEAARFHYLRRASGHLG